MGILPSANVKQKFTLMGERTLYKEHTSRKTISFNVSYLSLHIHVKKITQIEGNCTRNDNAFTKTKKSFHFNRWNRTLLILICENFIGTISCITVCMFGI